MLFLPNIILQFHLVDQSLDVATCWYCQPQWSVWGDYAVAGAPVLIGKLDIIIEDEQVHIVDNVEISFPGNVTRLQYCNAFGRSHDFTLLVLCRIPALMKDPGGMVVPSTTTLPAPMNVEAPTFTKPQRTAPGLRKQLVRITVSWLTTASGHNTHSDSTCTKASI